MSNVILYPLAFVVVLGVLIVVHELGHYAVARLCGIKVLRFSVGFGKPLWQRRIGKDGTEWAIAIFPLGGYVKMLDEREGDVAPAELHRAYNRQSVGKRSAVVAAGPLANFVLAILIYWVVFATGTLELLPILGNPPAGTPAAAAGLANGERVRRVDGEVVDTWQDFRWMLLKKAVDQDSAELEVINEKNEINFRRLPLAAIAAQGWQGDGLERLGVVFFWPKIRPLLGKLTPGGVAERAGMRTGDEIVDIDGKPTATWQDVVLIVRDSPGKALRLTLQRGDRQVAVSAEPERFEDKGKVVGRLGISVAEQPEMKREVRSVVRYGFFVAGAKAFRETWDKSVFSLVMLGKMLTGEVSWRNLSGPVTIADYAGQSAKLGIDYYLKFMALVSVSLGVLNLLPIPVLDGGHLLYHMVEVIKRGPLSERVMEIGQQIGLTLLLALMAFAFFNDINRLLSG